MHITYLSHLPVLSSREKQADNNPGVPYAITIAQIQLQGNFPVNSHLVLHSPTTCHTAVLIYVVNNGDPGP